MKDLLQSIDFYITPNNDFSGILSIEYLEPFCHYTHKNLKWKEAPFLPQSFQISLGKLTCVKYLKIKSFTHGSQMTVSIAMNEAGPFEEVYKDKFICKGKTLKGEEKNIDLGALPCRAILVSVTKGCKLSSQNISVVGTDVNRIEEKLGEEYFKLLVINPMKIIYP